MFLSFAVAAAIAAGWLFWLSGAIEEKRQKLKNRRGITRERSAFRKTLTIGTKYASYGLACVSAVAAWLHFGFGL